MGKDYTMDTKNQALLPRSDKLTMPHSFSPRNMTQKVMVQDPRSSQATTPKSRREEAVGHGTTACSTTNDSKHQLCWHRSSSLLPSKVQFCRAADVPHARSMYAPYAHRYRGCAALPLARLPKNSTRCQKSTQCQQPGEVPNSPGPVQKALHKPID